MGLFNFLKKGKSVNIEELIISEDIGALREQIENGLKLSERIPTEDFGDVFPLSCALMHKKYEAAKFFVDGGAELNDPEEPAILNAALYGDRDIIFHLVRAGANINIEDSFRGSALSCAVSEGNIETAEALIESGIAIERFGGAALRDAAGAGSLKMVKLLLERGADINYNETDNVYITKVTPLEAAIRGEYNEVAQYLIDNGADTSKVNEIETEEEPIDEEMKLREEIELDELAEIVAGFEIEGRHEYEWYVDKLKRLHFPEELIEYLGMSNKRIDLAGKSEYTEFIVLCTLDQLRIFKWNNILFVDLISEIDSYDEEGILAWLPEYSCLGTVDMENEKFGMIKDITWQDFLENPARYIDGALSWEFCE